MITGYESLLRVTEDGNIWWVLKDAIRLGAGYRPYSDDNLNLEPELRATSKRALANERTLIGAFSDARLTIERPMTFERDGFRYVDAEGFLDWLSQYITQTQAKITFPDELASEVRKTKAKAAASQTTIASQEFASLTLAFDDWFDKNLDDLPVALRQRVEREFSPMPWDNLSAEGRRSVALQLDYQHDPATEQDRQFWWDFFERMNELQAQIAKWKSAATPTASDISLKESRLKELQQELDRMQLQRRQATLPTANNGDACAAFPTMQKVAATEGKNTLLGYKSESRPPASVEVFSISREGSVWRLTYQGKTIHHKDIMGLRYIELLTRSPGEPINVNALYRVVTPPPPEVVGSALSEQNDEELGEEGLIKGQLADREEQIDQKTVNQSKQHLIKLKDLIEDAKERGDESKKAAYENEWEQIMKYLSANLGKDGQPRNTNRIDERIRKSVWKTINDAIKSISSQDSAIGAHLRACISTGNTPCYRPPNVIP